MPVSNNNYQNQITIIYELDEVKKTFRQYKRKEGLKPVGKDHCLSEFLRIEKNNGYNTFSGLNNLLRLRDASNWSVCTKLGLKPTGISNYYSTDVFVENKKKLCIVCYFKDNQSVELNVFPEFYPCKKSELTEKVKELTQSIAYKKGI
jgi:hypothetical protein